MESVRGFPSSNLTLATQCPEPSSLLIISTPLSSDPSLSTNTTSSVSNGEGSALGLNRRLRSTYLFGTSMGRMAPFLLRTYCQNSEDAMVQRPLFCRGAGVPDFVSCLVVISTPSSSSNTLQKWSFLSTGRQGNSESPRTAMKSQFSSPFVYFLGTGAPSCWAISSISETRSWSSPNSS